ncbi:MAG: phytanoyl-CoA dioxygenase family protein, partial [Chloroflexi bacterium]|nr:phytanoyl-CoA dioxygenase family protein [Chloroflexota bacterium]
MQFSALTPEQATKFERNGFFIVRHALDQTTLERVTAAVDRIFERGVREEGLNRAGAYEKRNAIVLDDTFLDLLDWPATVPLVPQLLTWDIQLDTSHIIVRPPQPPGTGEGFKAIGWHRDGGIATHEIPEPLPRLRLKVCYVLSDLSQPGRGNTRFVPGSHITVGQPPRTQGGIDPDGAIEVLASPGDAVIFENRIFHAVGPNLSGITRKTIFMGYSYRWLRPLDYVVQPPELLEKVKDNPIRWQLLGAWATDMAFSLPKDEDVPLRAWYREHGL